jgi:hypothetical protein
MNLRPTIILGLLAALALLLVAPAAGAASNAAATKKPPKSNAVFAGQIAALERTTNTLSGEIAALTAQAATLEGSVHAPAAPTIAGAPTPAPETPAGGDFSGSFPDPKLLPGTVGALELGEGSVTSDKVVDGSVRSSAIADGAITGNLLGVLQVEDFGVALTGDTLVPRSYGVGESQLFELGVPHEQTLALSTHCPGRTISGGWKLVPGEFGAEVMASVPAFIAGGKSTEHDWNVTVHEQFTNTTIRNRMDASGLCIE